MKKLLYLLAFLFCALPIHAQCTNANVQDFSGGTNGAVPTATTLAAGASGVVGNATWSISSNTSFTYDTAAAGTFNWNQSYCSGGSYLNTSTLGLTWDHSVAKPSNQIIEFKYPTNQGNLNVITTGVWFSTNLAQNSGVNIDNGPTITFGGEYNNVIVTSNGSVLYFTCEAAPTACHSTSGGSAPHINIASNYTRYWITTLMYRSDAGVTCSPPTTLDGCNRGRVYQEDAAHPGSVGTLLGEWYSVPGGTAQNPAYNYIGDVLATSSRPGETRRFDHWLNCYNTTIASCPWPLLPATLASNVLIDAKRKTDWTGVGIPNGVPSGTWTQIGTTLPAGTYAGATIAASMAGCNNQFYQLGAGTFTITGRIDVPASCELRGLGANSTFLLGSGVGSVCQGGLVSIVCIKSSDTGNVSSNSVTAECDWTAGYVQFTSSLTLTNCQGTGFAAIDPTKPSMLILLQCETGFTGSPVPTQNCTGTATDNGGLFETSVKYNNVGPVGCCNNQGDGYRRLNFEIHIATSVSGGNLVQINPPLHSPDWASGQSPQAYVIQPIVNAGVKNLSIDMTNISTTNSTCAYATNAYKFWIAGIACLNSHISGIQTFQVSNGIIEQNYLYNSDGTLPANYGIRPTWTWNTVIQNNIIQKIYQPIFADGPGSGNVIAYNFAPCRNQPGNTFLFAGVTEHFYAIDELMEGNDTCQLELDSDHGVEPLATFYRNFATGWSSQPANPITTATNAISIFAYSRYPNVVNNIVGTPGYHTTYQFPASARNSSVFAYGAGNGASSPPIPNDALTASTTLTWINYDTVTGAVRTCEPGGTNFAAALPQCNSVSEIPVSAPSYPNPNPTIGDTVAGQAAPPASLYLTSKPSWFGTTPFPAIGSDVSGGNVGQCAGALNVASQMNGLPGTASSQCTGSTLTGTGWAGHVNSIPARTCAMSLGMPLDGTGGAIPFDADTCYKNVIGGNSGGTHVTGVVY